jgi:hypothetical protein
MASHSNPSPPITLDPNITTSHLITAAAAPAGYPQHTYHSFVAGAVGGYFVWGRYSSVNQQIVLYLTSRILLGLWKRIVVRENAYTMETDSTLLKRRSTNRSYSVVAALVWGTVMALFEESPHVLQSSLKKSMDEIYRYDHRSSPQDNESTALLLPQG